MLDKESYPGIMGLNFIKSVTDIERPQFFYDINSTYSNLNFQYHDDYHNLMIIKYVLPKQFLSPGIDANKIIGLALRQHVDLQTTLQHASQVNRQTLVPGTTILPSDVMQDRPTIVVFTPISKSIDVNPQTLIVDSYIGWISAAFEVKKFFEDLVTPGTHVIVKDLQTTIFDSNPTAPICNTCRYTLNYVFAEREWLINVCFHKDRYTFYFSNAAIIGVSDLILSLLLAGLLWALTINKKRAQALAV